MILWVGVLVLSNAYLNALYAILPLASTGNVLDQIEEIIGGGGTSRELLTVLTGGGPGSV